MLEELKKLNYHGGKDELLFFINDIVGKNVVHIKDAKIMCSYTPGKRYLSVDELCDYCVAFGWICCEENRLKVGDEVISHIGNSEHLNSFLIENTVHQLFELDIFNAEMFTYDSVEHLYSLKNELFPLSLSSVRNALISQGFISVSRNIRGTKFHINSQYDSLVARHCKDKRKKISLEALKKKMAANEEAGELAELFVLEYEKKRLGYPLCDSVKRISEIDVTAGYDIVSFNSSDSEDHDRYIEVKAISGTGFYWSKNEYEIAKLRGGNYCIYLVSLPSISREEYEPEIIVNPADTIMASSDWLVEPQSYHIKKLS